jgi:hypothetical protein
MGNDWQLYLIMAILVAPVIWVFWWAISDEIRERRRARASARDARRYVHRARRYAHGSRHV